MLVDWSHRQADVGRYVESRSGVMSPVTTAADVERHTEVFAEAVDALVR
jgi:hypothetical protein